MNFYTFLVRVLEYDEERARDLIHAIRRIYNHPETRRYYKPENPSHERPSESKIQQSGPDFWYDLTTWQKFAQQNNLPLDEPPAEDFLFYSLLP